MLLDRWTLSTALLATAPIVAAQLPYNPTQLILSSDGLKVFQFSAQASQPVFSYFDVSRKLSSSSTPTVVNQDLFFLPTNEAFLPIADDKGVSVLFGDCTSSNAKVRRYIIGQGGNSSSWKDLDLDSSQTSISANYLSAGFAFTADGSTEHSSLYVFGGMCPDASSNATIWTSEASYSNTMYSVSSASSQSTHQLSVTGTRAPPIPEAGLTITPLSMGSTKSSSGQVSQQQNFVLLGGHTETAFINMSQIALFSLPEASWAFIDVNQPTSSSGELVRRDVPTVEPRSGHTAVLSENGSKIVVFGGWVGSVSNPASPQLAVLQVAQGYGGTGEWQWSIPKQTESPLSSGQGIYGHGAVMLPGDVMMVSGGTNIGSSKQKRSTQSHMFYNTNTGAWSTTYNPSKSHAAGGLDTSQRAGLGAGLGLGLSALVAILAVWLFYRRRLLARRAERERHLRELALGSERFQSSSRIPSRTAGQFGSHDVRSASWGSRQEQQIESVNSNLAWPNQNNQSVEYEYADGPHGVARTGTEVPSPTRGLRKSLSGRGPPSFGAYPAPIRGPGSVFRIDEAEEEGSIKSVRAQSPVDSRLSDPFKDPLNVEVSLAAKERRKDVQGWVEDWQSAAVSMSLSRNPSQSRTYSNLSQAQSSSEESGSFRTGRESPDKSDRTGSNLSERSAVSLRKSGTVSRQMSQRSMSAGYTLFASAAAAMAKLGGVNRETALERTASKRSISLNTGSVLRSASRARSKEVQSLLDERSPTKATHDTSLIKDYKNYSRTSSMTSQRKRPGIFGSVKRVLTGTGGVDVQAQVDQFEEKSDVNSPMKTEPEMSESNGPAFWQGKRGARDWNESDSIQPSSSATVNPNRRSTIDATSMIDDYDGEDWDVETAVQKRVVQVMFTVPKEKLRVVNADALSFVSRSDIDEKEDRDRRAELKGMDSVNEDDEKGKGRGS